MLIVPTYQRQSQSQAAPVNTQDLRIPQGNAFTALADVGATGLDVYQKERQRVDLADMQSKINEFTTYGDDLQNNTQNGLITLQGKSAIGQGEARAGQLSAKAMELRDSLPEYMRPAFDQQIQPLGRSYGNRYRQYEVGQRQQFEVGQQQGLLANLQTQAENSFDDNEGFVNTNLLAREQIMAFGQAHGQSPEEIEANWVNFRENSAKAALNAQLTAGRFDQFLARNGEPSDVGGVPRVTAHGNSSAARGLRNNNPGNIEASSENPWEGQAGSDGRFAKFETPEHGIRALGKNLLSYQRQGYDTVSEIVNRWAPASDGNDTDSYIKALCGALGIGANDQVDMSNPRTLAALCAGIVKHENGSQPYTTEQLGAGVSAALGLSALESSKRRTGNAAFDAASPATQGTYLRQAQAMQNEQRALYAQQLGTSLKDAYSAFDEGLQPGQLPTQADLINAYGPAKGLRQWQDLQDQKAYGGVISASKDMSPAARDDLLERLRPNDPNAENFAANQQRWTKMKAKFSELDKEWERNQGRSMVTNALNNGVALDPSNKSNKDAADSYFDSNLSNFNINNNDDVNAVSSFVAKTGIIPTKLASQLNAASAAKDPNVAIPAAELVSRIYDTNPAAVSYMPKEKQSFYLNAKRLKDAGVNPEAAVEQAYNLAYNQTDALKAQLASEQGTSSYKKDRLSAASDFVSDRSQFLRIDPSAKDTNTDAASFRQDYESLYDLNYRVSGGDANIAKKLTSQQIARAWSISEVNGSAQLMKYAPEALYQGGPSGWQAQQWEEEKQRLTYGEKSDPIETSTNVLNATTWRPGVATTTTPERKVKGDIILVPDASTPRNGDYSIMIRDKDKDGVPTLQHYFDADGRQLRYRPDLESWKPYQELISDQKVNVEQTMQKAQERRGFYDAHREFDDQYQEGHEKRVEKQKIQLKNYFRWSNE
ncbi:Uncharacterised protein [Serratia liquefaciens]|uniref:hypothetical protein n=1 Tax=Serratia liquefaciens TaxID=614 RepID=UPI00217B31B2|nr:hypothetical protein [Serratia liquefaciens]CAI2036883.1 Uncharacterised protein [Serratia liquefaciens]